MQREMERRIRAARRELNGYNAAIQNADGLTKAEIQKDFGKAAVKLKRQEAVYKDFSYKTGISTQNDRLQTTGFGKSICQKAVWANKNAFLPLVQNANNTEVISPKRKSRSCLLPRILSLASTAKKRVIGVEKQSLIHLFFQMAFLGAKNGIVILLLRKMLMLHPVYVFRFLKFVGLKTGLTIT